MIACLFSFFYFLFFIIIIQDIFTQKGPVAKQTSYAIICAYRDKFDIKIAYRPLALIIPKLNQEMTNLQTGEKRI